MSVHPPKGEPVSPSSPAAAGREGEFHDDTGSDHREHHDEAEQIYGEVQARLSPLATLVIVLSIRHHGLPPLGFLPLPIGGKDVAKQLISSSGQSARYMPSEITHSIQAVLLN